MANDKDDDGDLWKGLTTRPLDDFSEEAFLASERAGTPNFAILVLAMGQWCSRPAFKDWSGPTWAMDACKKYFSQSVSGTRPVSTNTLGSPGQPLDGDVLTLVATLLVDPDAQVEFECSDGGAKLSINRAIRVAISVAKGIPRATVEQTDINRIVYHWKRDKDRRLSLAYEAYSRKMMSENPLPKV